MTTVERGGSGWLILIVLISPLSGRWNDCFWLYCSAFCWSV
jgi:hypothetical protein